MNYTYLFIFRWTQELLIADEDTWLVNLPFFHKKCPKSTGSSPPIQVNITY